MKLHSRPAALAALALGLTVHSASSQAEIFDWNNVSYKPVITSTGAALQNLANSAVTDNTLSLSIDLKNGATFSGTTAAPSPASGSYATNPNNADNTFSTTYQAGGLATTQKALQISAGFGSSTQYMLVTILFAKPVTAVTFSFFDIDTPNSATTIATANQYTDQIRAIQGTDYNTGDSVTPVSLTNASNTYTSVDSATQVTGKISSAPTDGNANATVTFSSSTPLSQFSFVYGDAYTGAVAHATSQRMALGNITFTNAVVPEPGTTAMLGLGLFGAGALALRRRRCA